MAFQRLQDTDVYILIEFKRAVNHLIGKSVTKELQAEAATLGKPFLERLKRNGHDLQTCADMMRTAVGLTPHKV